jgi:hypothetical protein
MSGDVLRLAVCQTKDDERTGIRQTNGSELRRLVRHGTPFDVSW